jgi:septal ring factor EnvC (AmiA/AmiB activator)
LTPLLGHIALGLLAWNVAFATEDFDLDALRSRLDRLRTEIAGAEENRAEARDQLRESERAISEANRLLRRQATDRGRLRSDLQRLRSQKHAVEADIAARQQHLGLLLTSRYLHGEPGALQVLLSGVDPNRATRDLHYLGYISRAQAGLIRSLRGSLLSLREVEISTREASAAMATNEGEQRAGRARLLAQQSERRSVLARVSEKIREQRRQVKSLERDQARLGRLVVELTRVIAAAPPGRTRRNERIPEGGAPERAFASLKGSMRLPIRGELISRYGTPRSEGGPKWKGLFIRAPSGQEVRAVASGRVVYADWMRGFGNLLILDHGRGYLTIYGNNEAVLKSVGEAVRTGDSVATAGGSGGGEESGLYFEMRHEGRAFDPLKWISLK